MRAYRSTFQLVQTALEMEPLVIALLTSCEDYPDDMDQKTNLIMIRKEILKKRNIGRGQPNCSCPQLTGPQSVSGRILGHHLKNSCLRLFLTQEM